MIALVGSDLHWQGLLRQEGVSFRIQVGNRLEGINVLILDERPTASVATSIADHVAAGGAVLGYSGYLAAVWPELALHPTRLRYIIPDGSDIFRNVGLIDAPANGLFCPDARLGRTDAGQKAILADRVGKGARILLPFDLASVFDRTAAVSRQFWATTARLPTETVSAANRGEVRRLVAGCIRFLLAGQGLPYVHLAYVPGNRPSVFGFRVDTDFGPKSAIESVAQLADALGMRFSWYVNVGAHAEHLADFRRYASAGQDVQLHCYRHSVYRDYARNRDNLERGKMRMQAADLHVVGTVSPYGDWNPQFDRALADLRFSYSSEFGFDYDDLPCWAVTSGKPSEVLQVPVHPMSVGRLRAARASDTDIRQYYRAYVRLQVARQEPCFLYDHPQQISRAECLFRDVLGDAISRCGASTTLTDYCRWWITREEKSFDVSAKSEGLCIRTDAADEDMTLVVEMAKRRALVPLRSGTYAYNDLAWQEQTSVAGTDVDWDRLRHVGLSYRLRELRRTLLKRLQEQRA